MAQPSAIQLKETLKREQSDALALKVLLAFCNDLKQLGWQDDSANALLRNICTVTGADNGFIAIQDNHVLNVIAKQGLAYSIGARMPVVGNLALLLKSPSQGHIVDTPSPHCWPGANSQDCANWLVPIVYQQHAHGILGLHGKNLQHAPLPTSLLSAFSGLIGGLTQMHTGSLKVIDFDSLAILTPREREIFALLPAGLSNQDLANKLGIATGTIKIHIERILSKLNLKDRTQAAVKAVEMGYRSGS